MQLANLGLAIFVLVLVVDMAVLGLDVVLLLEGIQTITQRVMQNYWLGIPMLLWHSLGTIALAVHFYWRY